MVPRKQYIEVSLSELQGDEVINTVVDTVV